MKVQLLKLTYRHNTQLPEVVLDHFREISTTHNYETRSKNKQKSFPPARQPQLWSVWCKVRCS